MAARHLPTEAAVADAAARSDVRIAAAVDLIGNELVP